MSNEEMVTIPHSALRELLHAADGAELDLGNSAGAKWLRSSTDRIRTWLDGERIEQEAKENES